MCCNRPMASGRWGGPPDVKGTLGTLLRTTLYQVSAVKDAALREAKNRRGWLDTAVLQRRRKEALASLGEAMLQLSRAGALGELAEVPEVQQALADVDELDAQILEAEERAAEAGGAVSAFAAGATAPARGEPMRVWRPVLDDDERDTDADGDDAAPARPSRRTPPPDRARRRAVRSGGGISFVDEAPRPGDLDSDDDLAEYMHEDDVPGPDER